jgi:hypothetical protein
LSENRKWVIGSLVALLILGLTVFVVNRNSEQDLEEVAIEMSDSAQLVAGALETAYIAADDAATGYISFDAYAVRIEDTMDVIEREYDDWAERDVPAELEVARDHYVEGLGLYFAGFGQSKQGALTMDISKMEAAGQLLNQGNVEFELATAAALEINA